VVVEACLGVALAYLLVVQAWSGEARACSGVAEAYLLVAGACLVDPRPEGFDLPELGWLEPVWNLTISSHFQKGLRYSTGRASVLSWRPIEWAAV
jgi:hypothetical protein